MAVAERDWTEDVKGAEAMDFPCFFDSIFELADIWCSGVAVDEYVTFLFLLLEVRRSPPRAAMTNVSRPLAHAQILTAVHPTCIARASPVCTSHPAQCPPRSPPASVLPLGALCLSQAITTSEESTVRRVRADFVRTRDGSPVKTAADTSTRMRVARVRSCLDGRAG